LTAVAGAGGTPGRKSGAYHADTLPDYQEQYEALYGWIRAESSDGASVCDVGGGGHFLTFPQLLRPWVGRMVGVDPDAGVLTRPWYDEAHQRLVEDWAPTTTERFDVVTAVYVLEHVDAPGAFLRAVRSVLKPGGSAYGITPNLWHYFGLLSAASARLGLERWLLHRVRDHELVDDYHFPVRYRLNSLRRVSREAAAAGFAGVEFRCIEDPHMVVDYLPGPLRGWAPRYSAAVNRLGRPQLYGTMLFRLRA
jgi:SAM-dependent methyltransferase